MQPLAPRLLRTATALALLASAASAQGETGFLRGEGELDVVVGYTRDTYDRFWVDNDRMRAAGVGKIERAGYGIYAAYGLQDDLDLIVSANHLQASSDGAAGAATESDLQDLVVAGKWRVLEHEWSWGDTSLALLPGVKLPLAEYENNALTALGDGQVDLRGRLVLHAQAKDGFYASIETGYDRRNGAPDDEVPVHLSLGATVAGRVTVSPFLSHVESLGGTNIGAPGTNYFPANEEDFTRGGLGVFVRLSERVGLTASWRTTIEGRNTGDVEGVSLGAVFGL